MTFNQTNPIIADPEFMEEVATRTSQLLQKDDQMRKGINEALQPLVTPTNQEFPSDDIQVPIPVCEICKEELPKHPIRVPLKRKGVGLVRIVYFCCIDCWNRWMNGK